MSQIFTLFSENLYIAFGTNTALEFYTKTTTIAYLIVTVGTLSGFVSKTYSLLENKKSKQFYFYIYAIVFFLLFTQTLVLLSCPLAQHQDKAVLVLFIYTSALMILFLIFLALTSSETYQDLKKNPYKVSSLLNQNVYSQFSLFFFTLVFLKLFILDWGLSAYLKINDSLAFRDLLTSRNNFNQNNYSSYAETYNSINAISREHLYGRSPEDLLEYVQAHANVFATRRQSALFTYTPGPNTNNLFNTLRLEIAQNYFEYLLSGILQVLGLIFIISALIS